MSYTCEVEVWDRQAWTSNPRKCGRPVKADGLCGIHLAHLRRREAKEAAKAVAKESAQVVVERLARHGIEAQVGFSGAVYMPAATQLADLLDAKYPA